MITVADSSADRRRDLIWAALGSCALNLLVWVGAIWLSGAHLEIVPRPVPVEEYVVSSTAARIERRHPVPVPHHARVVAKTQPVVQPQQPHLVQPQPRVQPRLERPQRHGTPQPPFERPSFSRELAQQEQQFAREAAQLHAQNAPLSQATISPQAAAAMRKQYFNLSGANDREGVQAVLTPLKHWFDADRSCYYVHYDAQFTGGGSEEGTIPWPVCYPRTADRMLPLDHQHALPIPYPPPGFALAKNTYVTPLLRGIYERRPNP